MNLATHELFRGGRCLIGRRNYEQRKKNLCFDDHRGAFIRGLRHLSFLGGSFNATDTDPDLRGRAVLNWFVGLIEKQEKVVMMQSVA